MVSKVNKQNNHRSGSIDGINRPRQRYSRQVNRPTTDSVRVEHSSAGADILNDSDATLRQDIEDSLSAVGAARLDDAPVLDITRKPRHSSKKATKRPRKKWSIKKKAILAIIIVILLILAGLATYAYLALDKVSTVFKGNPTDILTPAQLKTDANGRSNVLVFGTSEDDEGHKGAKLADSIMVISVNQKTKDAAMFSVPRDLWVDYGMSCSVGNAGKINAGYLCALADNSNDEDKAAQAFASMVGKVFGLGIPYYVKVDYGAISGIVDTLGGVDVDVYSADSRGIYDKQTKLKLPAGVSHLDGQTALTLSRARNSHGGYGLPRSNFDREKNQQRIIQAIQKKALNAGVLANPQQALSILNSLGQNIKTNISLSELRQVLDIALGMGNKNVRSIDVSTQMKTGRVGHTSAVIPNAGAGSYTQLQQYVQEQLMTTSGGEDGATN